MSTATRHQLAAGVLFGTAIGDALGAATEFMSFDEIVAEYGLNGPREPGENVTDDTQLTIAVARALQETARPFTPLTLEQSLRKRFVEWNESPDNNRAPGTSCVRACLSLAEGYDWPDATAINSKGCGANMRVTPVAFLNFDRDGVTPKIRASIAQFQAAITHGHPTALAAADLTAAAVLDLLGGGEPAELCDRLREYAESQRHVYHAGWLGNLWNRPGVETPQQFMNAGWQQCIDALSWVEDGLSREKLPADICTICGEGWIAEEALACALLCFLIQPHDPVAAVRRGAMSGGDSDSIAALTGALAGAYHGIDAWPAEWVARVEYHDQITAIARVWDET